ncbi:hypothetical protein [Eisenbergiella porci]|jgi:hypothetical protein|nr:hypothetical protein [Eisenbergiella porci]DAT43447.1 MAG TPA: head to tail adaptor [Caudoviricetes sp.]
MTKQEKIKDLQERLELYKGREKEMLTGGVQSYGVGSRNATRYNTDLAQVRTAIKEIEAEISALECKTPRKAVGVIPRDW